MTDLLERLAQALADRCTIEREIGSGGLPVAPHCHTQLVHSPNPVSQPLAR